MEMDYFTAVNSRSTKDVKNLGGARHINTLGFNSSCFYRYARIDWGQLVKNLNGDVNLARRTVCEGFFRASIAAIPSGKQNSTAPLNPPSFLLAVVRTDGMGWNLANAFEKPVAAGYNTSLVKESIGALDRYWGKLETMYGGETLTARLLAQSGWRGAHPSERRPRRCQSCWLDRRRVERPARHRDGRERIMSVLLLRLCAPLQAWGVQSRFSVRDTTAIRPKAAWSVCWLPPWVGRAMQPSMI